MNADNVNRWLTLSANIGVVIGLILLLVEIDQNSDLVRAQIHQARSDVHIAMRQERANSEFLLPAMRKFESAGGFNNLAAIDQLTEIEAGRIEAFILARHQDYDNLFYQYQQGYLDEEFYQYRVANSIKRFAPWWEKIGAFQPNGRRPSFDAEIRRIMSTN